MWLVMEDCDGQIHLLAVDTIALGRDLTQDHVPILMPTSYW